MIGYLLTRALYALAVLFGVVSMTFVLLHVAGDPLAGLIPPGATPAVEYQIRHAYGLDRPLPAQYIDFVGHAMLGDFGDSWRQGRPALEAVLERLTATLTLVALATALAMSVGGILAIGAASRPGSLWDVVARLTALLGQAIPAFWLGTMLILVFAVDRQWLPSSGLNGPIGYILPALSLAAYPAATLTRLLRASMIETLGADYIRTARAKGLPHVQILIRHAVRNAALPTLAFAGLQAGFLLGGAVVVEGVFAFPGIGGLALDAVGSRDMPLVGAFVWTVAIVILFVNTVTAWIAVVVDPRLREDGLVGSVA
jgi:ABC-type dipeptide/oligopeptide/nickel transport system permease component